MTVPLCLHLIHTSGTVRLIPSPSATTLSYLRFSQMGEKSISTDFIDSLSAIASLDDPMATVSALADRPVKRRKVDAAELEGMYIPKSQTKTHFTLDNDQSTHSAKSGSQPHLIKDTTMVGEQQVEYHTRNLQRLLQFLLTQREIPANSKSELVQLAHKVQQVYASRDGDDELAVVFNNVLENNVENDAWKSVLDELYLSPVAEEAPEAPIDVDTSPPGLPPLLEISDKRLENRVFTHRLAIATKFYLSQAELLELHNERLEFLGDSIINNLVTLILYDRYPQSAEGVLTQMRSKLIDNKLLMQFAKAYGFDKRLKANIDQTVIDLGDQKIYADVFEAYIGALGIEAGMDFVEIKRWLEKVYSEKLEAMDANNALLAINKDAKLELYLLVGLAMHHPEYVVVRKGDGLGKLFTVECRINGEVLGVGEALNQKNAGLRAAMKALTKKAVLEKYFKLRMDQDPLVSVVAPPKKTIPLAPEAHSVDWALFPVPPISQNTNSGPKFKNIIYALCGQFFNEIPVYKCTEASPTTPCKALLYIHDHLVLEATDSSKKKAQSRAAAALTSHKAAMEALFGKDYENYI